MTRIFQIGDHVGWNSEAGHVSGRIRKIHTKKLNYKGYVHHASKETPQYEIISDKTDHIALHKATALKLLSRRKTAFKR
jgi:Hypervirulence associated proteins TUDOR domain